MLVELLVSVSITIALLGAVFGLVGPSHGALASQSHAVDVSQRSRAALGELHRHLLMAGSGPSPGLTGDIGRLRPPVTPARLGRVTTRPGSVAVSVLHTPPDGAAATLATPLFGPVARVSLREGDGCRRLPCGLTARPGGLALVFDAGGRSDLYRVTRVRGNALWLHHLGRGTASVYGVGATVIPVRIRSYYLDRRAGQLRVADGWGTDVPVLDNVVDLSLRYFGADLPPVPPVGADGSRDPVVAPCLAEAAGRRVPPAPPPPPRELEPEMFGDGPWCGGSVPFDIDLLRIRRVRVEIRFRVADDAWRRHDGPLLVRGGRPGAVADPTAVTDVVPRSLASW